MRGAGYRELQRLAKAMGVKANDTKCALRWRVLRALPTQTGGATPPPSVLYDHGMFAKNPPIILGEDSNNKLGSYFDLAEFYHESVGTMVGEIVAFPGEDGVVVHKILLEKYDDDSGQVIPVFYDLDSPDGRRFLMNVHSFKYGKRSEWSGSVITYYDDLRNIIMNISREREKFRKKRDSHKFGTRERKSAQEDLDMSNLQLEELNRDLKGAAMQAKGAACPNDCDRKELPHDEVYIKRLLRRYKREGNDWLEILYAVLRYRRQIFVEDIMRTGASKADAELAWTRKTTDENELKRRESFKHLVERGKTMRQHRSSRQHRVRQGVRRYLADR